MQEYIKNPLGSGRLSPSASLNNTILIISTDEMEDIIKTVKSLEEFGLLLKRVIETIQNEAKEQKGVFLSMLLRTFGASVLGNILAEKGDRAGDEAATKKEGK